MVRIITDSAADFEPNELDQLNITCIPLTVTFGQEDYQENINLSKTKFYELLLGSGEYPKTSQASPQHLMDLFEEAKESGEEAIYISLSSGISGTYQTACMTKNMVDYDGCYVVDSLDATGGQRMLVEYAAKLRDQGESAASIVEKVCAIRNRVVLYACIDTLEFLYRGGRISQTAYAVGNLAQIKPIIRVETSNGSISVPAKAMGMRKGMDTLCKRLEQQPPCADFPLYVMYTNNRAVGEKLAQRIRDMGYDVPDSRIIAVGAAIGAHIGPDACGLVYIA